jgi:general secretion pathway protein K
MRHYQKTKGMALFQVLLITAVISILALQFTQTAKNQIAIAGLIDDRIKANFLLATTESELMFSLFTEPLTGETVNSKNKFSTLWNFHGEAFTLSEEVEITIQAQNSLISVFRGANKRMLSKLVDSFNLPNVRGDVVSHSLADWQDEDDLRLVNGAEAKYYNKEGIPTNMPLQSMSELSKVRGVTENLFPLLKPYITIRHQGYFNPLNSPKRILALFIGNPALEKVIELRDNRDLSGAAFNHLTGMEDDETIGFSSNGHLKVTFKVTNQDILLIKESEFLIKPYEKQPYIEYAIKY